MANPASILVGCGGSGIRTLMRLNGLMAEDPYWRHRIARDIYYVLLDTELAMIDEFEATINRQLAGVDKPLMYSLRIAQGHVILQPLVRRYFHTPFEREHDSRGKERLFSHWWSDDETGPFTAPKVRPLTRGAGQCPAASYFLTWHSLLKVEDVFDRLIEELIARRSVTGEDPLAELNFCIVAGLAGGTGRGSWQLVAFKVREHLTKKYGIPAPVAYLFDQSVFENVYRRHPRQEVPMKVNSLTGVSELSCWMENVRTAGKPVFTYQLPSMEQPHDEQMDVLNVDLNLDTRAAAPVENAVLIFARHQRAVLAHNEQYHEMVGTGLYAALSRSSIESQRINDRPPFLSIGTATFEVNAVTLRRYFEGLMRIQTLRNLGGHNDQTVEDAADRFLNECRLRINITRTNRKEFTDDADGTIMQRACHELLAASAEDLAGLGGALETDDPQEVEQVIEDLLEPADDRVERAVQKAIDGLQRPPEEAARSWVGDLFRKSRSVANVRRFVEETVRRLEEEIDALPDPERMQVERDKNPLELLKEYQGREYIVFGRHFNEDECVDLEEQTARALLYANYGALRAEVTKHYRGWMSIIRRWHDSADMILTTSDKLTAKYKNELKEDIDAPGNSYDDFFDTLFTDFDKPEESTPEEFAKGRFYRRELKPALPRGGDRELLKAAEFKKELNDVVSDALLGATLNRDSYDELEKFRRDLDLAIRRTVHLPYEFIEQNFAIRNVVQKLRQAWLQRLRQARGQVDELEDLIQKFSTFYGIRPTRDGDDFKLPMDEEFVLEMGASLAGTCRPYWELTDPGHTEIARVSLFLPIAEDQETAERFIRKKLNLEELRVEVYTEKQWVDESGTSQANPFIMLAYSVEGVDQVEQIKSLSYWQSPIVKSLLLNCEESSGISVFDQAVENNGVSYTDPLFVSHDEIRSVRWKPWVDLDASVAAQDDETRDALLYALLRPTGELKTKLDEKGWNLPLIRDKGLQWYEFTRRALFWNGGAPREDTGCPWKARTRIAQSIWKVFDVVAGHGRPDGSLKLEGAKWADRTRQEARDFWGEVLYDLKAPKGSEPYDQLLADLLNQLDENAQKCADDDKDGPIWRGLLQRLKQLREANEL